MAAVAPARPAPTPEGDGAAPDAALGAVPSAPSARAEGGPFLWTRERYDQAVNAGVFGPDDKIELIEGYLFPQMPQNTPHSVATTLTATTLRQAFGAGIYVQEEKPIALSDLSEPEPDVAVIRGGPRDFLDDHPGPKVIDLIVEVAESSVRRDRGLRARAYAEAGINDYWIVNLPERVVEVHREPAGGTYRTKTTLAEGDAISPVARPDASVASADLLP